MRCAFQLLTLIHLIHLIDNHFSWNHVANFSIKQELCRLHNNILATILSRFVTLDALMIIGNLTFLDMASNWKVDLHDTVAFDLCTWDGIVLFSRKINNLLTFPNLVANRVIFCLLMGIFSFPILAFDTLPSHLLTFHILTLTVTFAKCFSIWNGWNLSASTKRLSKQSKFGPTCTSGAISIFILIIVWGLRILNRNIYRSYQRKTGRALFCSILPTTWCTLPAYSGFFEHVTSLVILTFLWWGLNPSPFLSFLFKIFQRIFR